MVAVERRRLAEKIEDSLVIQTSLGQEVDLAQLSFVFGLDIRWER
jgi:hypothetical protein